jgi:hypothetical protein
MKSERSTLERWVASQRPLSKGRKEEIDSSILRFIVLGMQPFSVVSNDAFKSMLTLLEPSPFPLERWIERWIESRPIFMCSEQESGIIWPIPSSLHIIH